MTSLEKMLKRVEFNQKNKLRAYDGLTPLELPVELMDEKEYEDYLRKMKQKSVADMLNDACVILNASKNPYARKRVYKDEPRCKKVNIVGLETAKEKIKKETPKTFKAAVNELKENLEKEMKKSSKVKEETKKATNTNTVKETPKTKAEKQKSTEIKDEPRCKKVNIVGLGPLQEETKKATNTNATEEPVKETKEEIKKSTEIKEESAKETSKTKEVKEPENEKITEIKNILVSLYSEIKDFNVKPLITDYDKLTAGKKKEAICELLKGFVASIAKEQKINFNDIVNFSCDIPSLANANNKRNYITMLKCLKDSITQKKYNISNKISGKIENEIANQITRNKKKLMTMLKSEDMTFTEDNIDDFIATIKAILSQIENGIPFEKIEECRKSDNNTDNQNQVVNDEFDETDSNDNEEEPIFMSSEQLEEVNQTINEIISGM